nr:DUF4192 domain-containing protein [Aeromicrobium sp. 9AM]
MPLLVRTPEREIAALGMRHVQPILDRGLKGERLTDEEVTRFSVWMSTVPVRDEVWGQITVETADDMLRLLTLVSRSVVPPFEPAVLSLTAFAAWLTGDGAQSLIAVERALRADQTYSMARLMLQMLEGGIAPSHWSALQAAEPVSP